MVESTVVRRKLDLLARHLDEFAALAQDCSLEEYRHNFERRHAIEKLIELIVEYANDVNVLILDAFGETPPQTYYNSFYEMSRIGILSNSLMPRLASATGLRNRLVHQYESVDDETVYYSLKPLLRNYRQYVKVIEKYLSAATEAEKRKPKGRKRE